VIHHNLKSKRDVFEIESQSNRVHSDRISYQSNRIAVSDSIAIYIESRFGFVHHCS